MQSRWMVYVQLRVVGGFMIVKVLLEIHKLSLMDHECPRALDFSKLLKRRSVACLIIMADV
jgi:hypothetical protein